MALHFYMNGTTGAQDGVEISNGDLSNPLVFDGFYAASGVELSKTKTIHIRADTGETWEDVFFTITGNTTTAHNKFEIVRDATHYCFVYIGTGAIYMTYYGIVTDTNLPIQIIAYVNGSDTDSPNDNDKITIVSGRKIA